MSTLGRLTEPEQFADIIVKTGARGKSPASATSPASNSAQESGRQHLSRRQALGGHGHFPVARLQRPGKRPIASRRKCRSSRPLSPRASTTRSATTPRPISANRSTRCSKRSSTPCSWWPWWCSVFLQNWRSALIPLIAVPVAIVGTFAAMAALGFSLNTLSLFGLVLAIGIVVDDAIVVVEATERHIEAGHGAARRRPPGHGRGFRPRDRHRPGADRASSSPASSSPESPGSFFRQFALTIAVSTILSTINSLTLSPALCAILLKPRQRTATCSRSSSISCSAGSLRAVQQALRLVDRRIQPDRRQAAARRACWCSWSTAGCST